MPEKSNYSIGKCFPSNRKHATSLSSKFNFLSLIFHNIKTRISYWALKGEQVIRIHPRAVCEHSLPTEGLLDHPDYQDILNL